MLIMFLIWNMIKVIKPVRSLRKLSQTHILMWLNYFIIEILHLCSDDVIDKFNENNILADYIANNSQFLLMKEVKEVKVREQINRLKI